MTGVFQEHHDVIHATRAQLLKAGRQVIETAAAMFPSKGVCDKPNVAAYLNHVGLECSLKAWLLVKSGASDTYQLLKRLPEREAETLFTGRSGHNLALLAEKALLKRLLVAENEAELLKQQAWTRLISGPRPYELRYGVATLRAAEAFEEVALGKSLLERIERVVR